MRMLRVLALAGGLVVLGLFAYETGAQLAQREVKLLRDEIRELSDTVESLEGDKAQLQVERDEALEREAEALQRYQRDVPAGASRDLFRLVQQRLEDGLGGDRLAFVIRNATEGSECEGGVEMKRFMLRTPLYEGGNDWVGFDNTTIVVTGEGESATNPDGAPYAWYDPAEPVRITFTTIGGEETVAEGMLPLAHSLVRNGTEYRFSVTEGDSRGFVNVAAAQCPYP